MSADIILVAGLPGCGKTTYLCEKLRRDGWLVGF
jgi:broad-specificity NMP kinase